MRLELGDFTAAERAWRRLVELHLHSGRGHAQLGSLCGCFEQNAGRDAGRAEIELARALEINGEQVGPRLRLGFLRLLVGDRDGAEAHLDAVLGSDPGSAPAHYLKGYLAWTSSDAVAPREHFEAPTGGTGRVPAPERGPLQQGRHTSMERRERESTRGTRSKTHLSH